MDAFVSQLARVRAHAEARRPLPDDLADWAIEELSRVAGSTELRLRRNAHLCRAGEIVGGSLRHRALAILKESACIERLPRARAIQLGALEPLRAEVCAAQRIAPMPAERQLRSILAMGVTIFR